MRGMEKEGGHSITSVLARPREAVRVAILREEKKRRQGGANPR